MQSLGSAQVYKYPKEVDRWHSVPIFLPALNSYSTYSMLRRLFTIIPLILLIGSSLLLFFVVLVGASDRSVLSRFYWSEVDTSNLPNARFQRTRWTSYRICGVQDGRNHDCGSVSPAYPYSPADNFDSTNGLPNSFVRNRDSFYYLSRFAYVFFLLALLFSVVSLLFVVLSCCLSGFISGLIGSIILSLTWVFSGVAAAFTTAVHVRGRNLFNDQGHSAKVGVTMFGIMWAAFACITISFLFMIFVGASASSRRIRDKREQQPFAQKEVLTSSNSSTEPPHLVQNNQPYYN